ncbi:MAG: bifunctional folylpolyglutamate synthase/dihydrofolate synthase [Alloprevotella sp.]
MTYSETIDYLFHAAPLFQQIGGKAYKPGLQTTLALDEHFDHPHKNFRTIHIAGTNGKGSCAHTLAAILQLHGYKVGLYTSPHLIDFRERIRVNGEMIPEDYVVDFVAQERAFFEPLHPSFFEITTALAFKYFSDSKVDVAVIETGLGGRLDCTNIILPELSLITNISLDHTQFLGHTLAEIATEKAGIIKAAVPVVVGETTPETRPVFLQAAKAANAPIVFAEDTPLVLSHSTDLLHGQTYVTKDYGTFSGSLMGECQVLNTNTLLHALILLTPLFGLKKELILQGFREVCALTGLKGRWQVLQEEPFVVCDAGHNSGGWQHLSRQLKELSERFRHLHVVFGMAEDKDIETVLTQLPKQAHYFFTQASVRRACPAERLSELGKANGLKGETSSSVAEAYDTALRLAEENDCIYVGGSCFVVADLLTHLQDSYK